MAHCSAVLLRLNFGLLGFVVGMLRWDGMEVQIWDVVIHIRPCIF